MYKKEEKKDVINYIKSSFFDLFRQFNKNWKGALTLFLSGLYFANRILLKNAFVIVFGANLLSILGPRVFEQVKRLYEYCYAPDHIDKEEEYPDPKLIELRKKR